MKPDKKEKDICWQCSRMVSQEKRICCKSFQVWELSDIEYRLQTKNENRIWNCSLCDINYCSKCPGIV